MNRDVCEHGNPEPCDKCNAVALRLADLIDSDLKNAAHHAEAAAELRRLHEIEKQYHELLYAVGNKYEGESRHQTALRYIQQAEIVVPFAAKERNHD